MSFYVYNDNYLVGRWYWNQERAKWVKLYEKPTLFTTERDAETAIVTFLLLHPNLSGQTIGIVDETKVGTL